MALNEGDILAGKYKIERLLGEGGMGSVYVASNQVLQKRVALKVMSERFASVPAAVERFLREAVAASRVTHASIVQVFDAGDYEGKPWIAMELLEGESLGERLERGPMSVREVLKMADGALSALAEVHEEGIIHRDLKPDNIFLARARGGDWIPKVLDFGVAKDTSDGQLSKLTATGAVVGTAHYLSPEQAKGLADIDARADVYAMGVVLFESLSGRMPYEAETITQLIAKMFTEEPRKLDEIAPHVPRPIADVVNTCLDQDRNRRFQTARGLLGALRSAAQSLDGKNIASAPTEQAMSSVARGTARAAHAPPGGGGYVGSDPGLSATGLPGPQHASYLGGSHPGAHGSYPGPQGSYPGPQGSYPGAQASHPGAAYASHPGAAHGFPATAAGTPMPANRPGFAPTAMMASTPPSLHGAPEPRSGSKLPMIALVLVLFVLGAGGTGVGAWVLLGSNGDGAAVAHTAAATQQGTAPATTAPTSAPTTAPSAEVPTANVPTTADTPDGVDPQPAATAEPVEPPATAPPEDDESPARASRRRPPRRGEPREPPTAANTANTATVAPPEPRQPPAEARHPQALRNGLSQAQVMTAIQQRLPYIHQACYVQRAANVPGLQGVVTVSWSVRGDGRAENVQVVHNGTGDDWLGRCTRNAVADTRFPPGANGLSTPARYPFQFRPR